MLYHPTSQPAYHPVQSHAVLSSRVVHGWSVPNPLGVGVNVVPGAPGGVDLLKIRHSHVNALPRLPQCRDLAGDTSHQLDSGWER